MNDYVCYSTHAEDLEGGRVVGPGESFQLSAEEERSEHNQRLIQDGVLVRITKPKEKEGGKTK